MAVVVDLNAARRPRKTEALPERGEQLALRRSIGKLAPQRLPKEPESELTDLVRQMGQGSFDYDVLTYDIVARPTYASGSYTYYDNYYDPPLGGTIAV